VDRAGRIYQRDADQDPGDAGLHRYHRPEHPRVVGCAEGLNVTYVNKKKMEQWIGAFPGALNDTGDLPVYKRGDRHLG